MSQGEKSQGEMSQGEMSLREKCRTIVDKLHCFLKNYFGAIHILRPIKFFNIQRCKQSVITLNAISNSSKYQSTLMFTKRTKSFLSMYSLSSLSNDLYCVTVILQSSSGKLDR